MFDALNERLSGQVPGPAVVTAAPREAAATPPSPDESLARLLPAPDLMPVPAPGGGGALLSLEQRYELIGGFCLTRWLTEQRAVTARLVLESVPELRGVYRHPNAVGTVLGRGVSGHGFGLRKREGASEPSHQIG